MSWVKWLSEAIDFLTKFSFIAHIRENIRHGANFEENP
jgi:hypothetical protein